MAAPKTPEAELLAAIRDLGERMSKLEVLGNDLIVAQMENAALIQALIDAISEAPQVLLGGVEVETPPDLDLNTWIEGQKRKS